MSRKVIIVTGANTGIGYVTAKSLCEGGNDVILACRNEEKGKAAVEWIVKQNPKGLATFMQLDLGDLASVRKFVETFHQTGKKLNVLINNAGLMVTEKRWTKDNFEMMMGTNHLARNLLSLDDFFLDKDRTFNTMQAYKNSKLCNVLMTHFLSKQLEGSLVTCNCVCPGFIKDSDLWRDTRWFQHLFNRFIIVPIYRFKKIMPVHTIEEGGRCLVELAVKEEYKGISGKFFSDYVERKPSNESLDEDLQRRVYELSARYCHIPGYEPLDALPPSRLK